MIKILTGKRRKNEYNSYAMAKQKMKEKERRVTSYCMLLYDQKIVQSKAKYYLHRLKFLVMR